MLWYCYVEVFWVMFCRDVSSYVGFLLSCVVVVLRCVLLVLLSWVLSRGVYLCLMSFCVVLCCFVVLLLAVVVSMEVMPKVVVQNCMIRV